jgi:hypothetical protein
MNIAAQKVISAAFFLQLPLMGFFRTLLKLC